MRISAPAKKSLVAIVAMATTLMLAVPALGGGRPLSTDLSPDNEVPSPVSDASGTAAVTLNQGLGEVCFEIETSVFASDVLFAHIHDGPAGVNGPVVVTLFDPDPPGPGGTLPAATQSFSGCTGDVDEGLIKDIRQNSGEYYVNVHTLDNPGGEIRGQLSR